MLSFGKLMNASVSVLVAAPNRQNDNDKNKTSKNKNDTKKLLVNSKLKYLSKSWANGVKCQRMKLK